jgi:long-subunit fatty acid transport protein
MGTSGRSKWRNVTIGIGVNRVANFNNSVYFKGLNNKSSYSEKYLEELINNNVTNPNSAANNFPYGASLAFNTYLIDTIRGAGGNVAGYRSLATPQTGVNQEQTIQTSGGMNEIGLALSGNLGDKFYIGGSLLWNVLNYERTSLYRESDATTNNKNNFNYFTVEDYLSTTGIGIGLKLGMIFKPVDQLRLGLAFHTPTVYNLKDLYASTLTSDLEGYAGPGTQTQSSRDFNSGADGEFTYNLNNPLRIMGGISYVLREDQDVTKQRGFISADIEYLNYRGSSFSSSDPSNNSGSYFNDLNGTIDNYYRSAINARVGGELKFNTLMVRGGFAYFGNPYQTAEVKGSRMNISGGLGYRDKGKFIDLTYVHQIGKDGYFPYRLDNGFFAPVNMKSGVGNILLTVGFKF